jgi:hypothetical protein
LSTVQEIYTQLEHWVGEDVDILSLFNLAQNLIAKRLYWLGSYLIIEPLEVSIFSSDTITGTDIAFVAGSGSADTITQTAAGFLTAGFQANMPITTNEVSNPGHFKISSVAAGVITLDTPEVQLIRGETGIVSVSSGSSVTIVSDDSFGYLPEDFWGLKCDNESWPYLDGKTTPLMPLPSSRVSQQYTSSGIPAYYQIKANRIYVTPHTSGDYTIRGDYFQKPIKLELLSDTLPWNELFDDLFHELVINIFKKGAILEQDTIALCHHAVDLVVLKREGRTPFQATRGISYEDYV